MDEHSKTFSSEILFVPQNVQPEARGEKLVRCNLDLKNSELPVNPSNTVFVASASPRVTQTR